MKKRLIIALFLAVALAAGFITPAVAVDGEPCPCECGGCCVESVNPHGENIPPAGWSTLPGPKGGKNDDGFYKVCATGCGCPINIGYMVDSEVVNVFVIPASELDCGGCINVKFTEAPGAPPMMKKMGSTNGQAGAVAYHFILPGEPTVNGTPCPVPPPPK